MTTQPSAPGTDDLLVPEIGPALGRLTAVPGARVGASPPPRVELADLRLAMVGRLFELAGKGRAAGDPSAAVAFLAPERLRQEWDRAAGQVAARTLERIQAKLAAAAERSGLPPRRLRRLAISAEEAALITARLRGAGVPYVDGLTVLDLAEDGTPEWGEALLGAMRRLELCWIDLEQRASGEEGAWESEAALIVAWRPARWPRWVAAGAIVLVLVYAGLVLGGFVPVPPGADGITSWWWAHE